MSAGGEGYKEMIEAVNDSTGEDGAWGGSKGGGTSVTCGQKFSDQMLLGICDISETVKN